MGDDKRKTVVLITGSSGYIASNLIPFLQERDFDIIGIDKKIGISVENFNRYDYDAIVHLAAISGISECNKDLKQAVVDNIVASIMIFNLARKRSIPVIFTSTQAAKIPDANLYGMTKRIAEIEAERLNKIDADIRVFRLTNVYGGIGYLENKDTVISRFVKASRNNEDIVINGNGSQIRDFIHVNDVCRAIYKGLMLEDTQKLDDMIKQPMDIGTGRPLSILELAKIFKIPFTFNRNSNKIGIDRNVADTKLAKDILEFETKESIEEYIKEKVYKNV